MLVKLLPCSDTSDQVACNERFWFQGKDSRRKSQSPAGHRSRATGRGAAECAMWHARESAVICHITRYAMMNLQGLLGRWYKQPAESARDEVLRQCPWLLILPSVRILGQNNVLGNLDCRKATPGEDTTAAAAESREGASCGREARSLLPRSLCTWPTAIAVSLGRLAARNTQHAQQAN
jgi:hypothetical protein